MYASIQAYLNIEEDGDLNKYIGINMVRRPYASIYPRHPYLTQRILDMIPNMNKSSDKPTPGVKSYLSINEGSQARKISLIKDQQLERSTS